MGCHDNKALIANNLAVPTARLIVRAQSGSSRAALRLRCLRRPAASPHQRARQDRGKPSDAGLDLLRLAATMSGGRLRLALPARHNSFATSQNSGNEIALASGGAHENLPVIGAAIVVNVILACVETDVNLSSPGIIGCGSNECPNFSMSCQSSLGALMKASTSRDGPADANSMLRASAYSLMSTRAAEPKGI